jgi:hypothetical protein
MPALADHPVVRPEVPPPTTQVRLVPPPPPPCGLLMIQEAILRDAAADVAGIELQMARAQSTAWLLEHGLAAVDVLDRTIRLLQAQRPALLDQLAEVLLSAHQAEVPRIERLSADLQTSRLAGGA